MYYYYIVYIIYWIYVEQEVLDIDIYLCILHRSIKNTKYVTLSTHAKQEVCSYSVHTHSKK